ncbi:MAG: hypothetical protein ACYC2G_07390 [Gemmatimonadaceae bacterium]
MHTDPIIQAAVAGQPAAPPPAPAILQREGAVQAQEAAVQARVADAEEAAQAAAQRAAEAAGGARTFRIERDGKVVTVGPEGVVVTSAQPGMTAPIPVVPQEAVVISIAFFVMVVLVVIGWPIARAIARRMDRQTAGPARGGTDNGDQLRRIEQAVEAMAIEVERVSENQRFVTRLLSERRPDEALLASADEAPVAARASSTPPAAR